MCQNFGSLPVTNVYCRGTYCTKRQNSVSTIERYHLQNCASRAEKAILVHGTRLEKARIVKGGFSYRNILLGVGIAVALIVILTFWASRNGAPLAVAPHLTSILSYANDIPSFEEILRKATNVEF